ncbi:E3 ubiquitin-protein ligase MARCHF2-like isoform X2 [Bacillus rossius redtenbacheri]|uniref:E3 ubiquitin-protein ligase MARCHF2-like isoform X2 n=1 Tax=Bacillus rossius redtenbacheri TaxID=93214 RepID=UPI002FDDAC87
MIHEMAGAGRQDCLDEVGSPSSVQFNEDSFYTKEEMHTPPKECQMGDKMVIEQLYGSPVLVFLQPHSLASASSKTSSPGRFCRICHEDDRLEGFVSPCDCSGTQGLVHIKCLEKWLSSSNTDKCEICKFKFSIRKHPQHLWQWLYSHQAGVSGPHGIYGDLLCLVILAPLCLVSVYLCGMGAAVYMRHGIWEGTGLALLCCFLLLTFVLWCTVTIRFHLKVFRSWQARNQVVHLQEVHYRYRRGGERVEAIVGGRLAEQIVPDIISHV